jgi:hypothetical protein
VTGALGARTGTVRTGFGTVEARTGAMGMGAGTEAMGAGTGIGTVGPGTGTGALGAGTGGKGARALNVAAAFTSPDPSQRQTPRQNQRKRDHPYKLRYWQVWSRSEPASRRQRRQNTNFRP